MIRHSEEGLARKAKPFQLHGGGYHRVGLPCSNDVCEQCVGRLQDAPHAGLLVRSQRDRLARAGQGEMIAIEGARSNVVEAVVVQPREPLAALVIRPNPGFEPLLDFLLLVTSAFGRLRVDDRLLVAVEVVNRGCLEIQSVLNQIEGRGAVRAPIRGIGYGPFCLPISGDKPRSQHRRMVYVDTG